MDLFTDARFLVRWIHVLAGIIWVGHLHFFNFVYYPQSPASRDGAAPRTPMLLPRALWWFRWAAMITFLAGLTLFVMTYLYAPGAGFGLTTVTFDEGGAEVRATRAIPGWILFGMFLGFLMWANVWLITWPAHKKLLSGRVAPDDLPALRARVHWFSRMNTYLSGPMLIGMLATAHYGSISGRSVAVFALLSVGAMWLAVFHSPKYSVPQVPVLEPDLPGAGPTPEREAGATNESLSAGETHR